MATKSEIVKVLTNPRTKELVEFVDRAKQFSNILISPVFFHTSYSERDKQVLVEIIKNYYDGKVKITRSGKLSATLEFN